MISWATVWRHSLGLSTSTPEWFVAVIVLVCVYCLVIFPCSAIIAYLERKFGADLQARVGPNRAGPAGFLQPIADFLKVIQKEQVARQSWYESFWLGVHTMALYSTVAIIPLGSTALLIDTDMSAFMPFLAALILSLGIMLLGFNQHSVHGWFGGLRVGGQALAGAFPALIAVLCVGISAQGFRWTQLAEAQGALPFSWAAFSNPFQFIAFIVFVISGLILLSVPPLDGGLSISDLHGGVASQQQGRQLSLFRLSRFYGFFLWSVIAVVLFLGAWNLPKGVTSTFLQRETFWILQIIELLVVLVKTVVLMLFVIWIARVNPRIRADQITDFSWKVLSPLSLIALIGAAICGIRGG